MALINPTWQFQAKQSLIAHKYTKNHSEVNLMHWDLLWRSVINF